MTSRRSQYLAWTIGLALAATAGLGLVRGKMRSHGSTSAPGRAEGMAPASAGSVGPADPKALTLDRAQREFLWQVEHHGLALNKYGFKAVAEALRRDDREALLALTAEDFAGEVPARPKETRLATDFAEVVRRQDTGSSPERLGRAAFLDLLFDYRHQFTRSPRVKLALMALSPVDRDRLDGPWQGSCQLRMVGEMGEKQPGEVVLYLRYRVDRPTEAALKKPGWLHACALTQAQTARAPKALMREVTRERGVDPGRFHDNWTATEKWPNTGGAYLTDYDRDGRLDLLITDINGYALYRGGPGGKFAEVTARVGLPPTKPGNDVGENLLAAFVDLDGDGWDDLLLGDSVYRNDAGRGFENVTSRTNLRLAGGAAGVAVADYDRDGKLDLYVARVGKDKAASWVDGQSGDSRGNQLWRNLGGWKFEDVTESAGATAGRRSTFTAVWLDADDDGWPDLYVINEFGNGVLLVNRTDGAFRAVDLIEGPGDFGSMGATAGDIDNDGRIDLYVANMYSKAGNRVIGNLKPGTYPPEMMARLRSFVVGSQLHRNLGGGKFEQLGKDLQVADVGWAYGPALLDLDNDGWLDLFATCGFISQSRDDPDG